MYIYQVKVNNVNYCQDPYIVKEKNRLRYESSYRFSFLSVLLTEQTTKYLSVSRKDRHFVDHAITFHLKFRSLKIFNFEIQFNLSSNILKFYLKTKFSKIINFDVIH